MRPISLSQRLFWLAGLAAAAAVSACDDPLALPPALFENTVDTATMYALRGTAIQLPSAYDIVSRKPARTDRAESFDFAFDIDGTGRALVLPSGALGIDAGAGVQTTTDPFGSVVTAPLDGYLLDSAVVVQPGTIFIARSRGSNANCALLGTLPRYGKFRVLAFDAQLRTLTVETLVNANCGYRGLEPGLPTS